MNTKYILLSLAALLVACSESEDVLQNHNKPRLTISTECAEYGTTRAFSTGLGSETEFRQGNAIGVSLVTTNDKAYRYNDVPFNLKAIYGNGWSMTDAPVMENNKAKLYAYYPFTDSYNVQTLKSGSNHTGWTYSYFHSIPIDITPYPHGDGQQDYLWGESSDSVNCDNPHARIQFKHVLPRITFKVTKGDECADDEIYVRQAFLKAADESKHVIGTKGNLSIFSGQATMDANQETTTLFNGYTAPIQIYTKEVTGEVRTFDFLVFPVTFNKGDVILSIETYKGQNGKLETYDITLPAATWEAGKQYTYPVVVNMDGEQQQESKPGEKVYMGFNGDNGKPLYWSSWNLGAKKIEDYGGLYGWGDPTGEHKEHCYEYKKDDPYYMTDKTKCLSFYGGSSPTNNISGVWDYDTAKRLWGGNWRIPTQNEFNLLKSNCTYVWTTLNNVYGMKFTSKTNGNSIFLPYAPSRYGNYLYYAEWNTVSGTYYQGSDYWSSNLNTDDVTRAHMFDFGNNNSCWIAKGSERYAGLPIRPVSD